MRTCKIYERQRIAENGTNEDGKHRYMWNASGVGTCQKAEVVK